MLNYLRSHHQLLSSSICRKLFFTFIFSWKRDPLSSHIQDKKWCNNARRKKNYYYYFSFALWQHVDVLGEVNFVVLSVVRKC